MSAPTRRRLFGLLAVAPVAVAVGTTPASASIPAYGRLLKVGTLSANQVRALKAEWEAYRGAILSDVNPFLDAQRSFSFSIEKAADLNRATAALCQTRDEALIGVPSGPDNGGLS